MKSITFCISPWFTWSSSHGSSHGANHEHLLYLEPILKISVPVT